MALGTKKKQRVPYAVGQAYAVAVAPYKLKTKQRVPYAVGKRVPYAVGYAVGMGNTNSRVALWCCPPTAAAVQKTTQASFEGGLQKLRDLQHVYQGQVDDAREKIADIYKASPRATVESHPALLELGRKLAAAEKSRKLTLDNIAKINAVLDNVQTSETTQLIADISKQISSNVANLVKVKKIDPRQLSKDTIAAQRAMAQLEQSTEMQKDALESQAGPIDDSAVLAALEGVQASLPESSLAKPSSSKTFVSTTTTIYDQQSSMSSAAAPSSGRISTKGLFAHQFEDRLRA